MKVLPLSLLTCLIATGAAARTFAQSASAPPAAVQPQAAQSPELEEAARLSREVVRLHDTGKYADAVPLAERALAIREKSLGRSAVPVADALANLGGVLAGAQKFDRARDAYERAAAIYEASLGPDGAKTSDAFHTLGLLHYRKGAYGKAESAFRRAVESRERTLGQTHVLSVESLSRLAAAYLATGDARKRDETFSRLLDAAEKMAGPTPKGLSRMFLSYNCTGARRDDATERQREIVRRIDELGKRKAEEQAAGTRRASVEGGVLNGRAISKPAPKYPEEAIAARVSGIVVVHITVDETGRVVEAEAICGPLLLYEAAVGAAWQARFTPTLLSGQPVKVSGLITYNFNLR